jgi:stage II sporulation protein D
MPIPNARHRRRCRIARVGMMCCLAMVGIGTATTAATASPGTVTFTFYGRGAGHGVGMSQYGAQGAARAGWNAARILAWFYRGTRLGTAATRTIRVQLDAGSGSARIGVTGGGVLTDTGSGAHHVLRGGVAYTVRPSGRGLGFATPTGTLRGGAGVGLRVTPMAGGVVTWNGRPYRGALLLVPSAGAVRVIDAVPLEQYLRGVVPSEMPSTWRAAALQAQAIAARSYALRSIRPAAPFDVYADTRSQAYGGVSAEAASTNAAVARTAGVVVTYRGAIVPSFFFASDGGYTESVQNVWGGGAAPYLTAVPDPFDGGSPWHAWPRPPSFTGAELGRLLGAGGAVSRVVVLARGVSPRVRSARVDVSSGRSIRLSGATIAADLGLPSTWFWVGQSNLPRPSEPRPGGGGTIAPAPPRAVAVRGTYMLVTRTTGSVAAARAAFARLGPIAPGRQLLVRRSGRVRLYLVVAVRTDSAAQAGGARRALRAWGIAANIVRARSGDPRPLAARLERVRAMTHPVGGATRQPGGLVPATPASSAPGAPPAP